jgi:hypothetical protein
MFQNKKPGSVQRNLASRPLVARQDGWWRDQLGDGSLPRSNPTKSHREGSKGDAIE